MNKLLVEDILDINHGDYNINISNKEAIINICDNANLYLKDEHAEKIIFKLKDNIEVNIYDYHEMLINNIEIIIEQNNNSKINYFAFYKNNDSKNLTINNYIKGNNNISNIYVRNISEHLLSSINVNLYILNGTVDNVALEDLRGITNGGFIEVNPNIICESNEVEANHITTIGVINKEDINYLCLKGINEELAKKLLLDSFLISKMDNKMKELIGGEQIE